MRRSRPARAWHDPLSRTCGKYSHAARRAKLARPGNPGGLVQLQRESESMQFDDRLGAILRAERTKNRLQVHFDGRRRDIELARDLLDGSALHHERADLLLARR